MMKKILVFLIVLIFLFSARTKPVKAEFFPVAGSSAIPKTRLIEKKEDPRVKQLRSFLLKQKSPLVEQAASFIEAADKYGLNEFGLDYLVPAITGVESSFGKHYPRGSYNAFGWAGGAWRFDSWEDSIDHVTRVLRQKYIDRGADTVYKIGPIYAESPTWSQRVSYFIERIESYNPLQEKLVLTL